MRPEIAKLNLPLPLAIIGLGISGLATKNLLLEAGFSENDLCVFDDKQTPEYSSLQNFLDAKRPKSICVSPGIPLAKAELQNILKSGARLTSELELATAFLDSEKIVAITGSIGKSTVTSLIGAAGKVADQNIFVGGNLGIPLAEYSLQKLAGKRPHAKYIILELSSYQLENFQNLKADIGVLTYLSPNHMERYQNLYHYYDTKLRLLDRITQGLVCNSNGGDITEFLKKSALPKNYPTFFIDRNSSDIRKYFTKEPTLLGKHNLDNIAVAFKVCEFLKWPQESFLAALEFKGLPHRLENCGEKAGVLFINDSKATAMDPVLQAYQSIRDQFPGRKIHLLLGGKDKDLPWKNLNALNSETNLVVSFFGAVGALAHSKSQLPGQIFKTLGACLADIKNVAKAGDIVLLSPGGTSWDEFKSFEERGDFFKKWLQSEF